MDADRLRILIDHHEKVRAKRRTLGEKKWLAKDMVRPHPKMSSVNEQTVSFFTNNIWVNKPSGTKLSTCIRNLVGSHWLTDRELMALASIINKQSDAICFVLQNPILLFSDESLQRKLDLLCSHQESAKSVFIFINVGKNNKGQTHMDLDGNSGGCHWALLFFEAGSSTWYYGDSLGWLFPSKSDSLVSALRQIEQKASVTLIGTKVCCQPLHNPSSVNSKHTHTCKGQCSRLYPLQNCSSVCGVVVATMAALLSQSRGIWPDKSNCMPVEHMWIQSPSKYSDYLRKVLIEWVLNEDINLHALSVPQPSASDSNNTHEERAEEKPKSCVTTTCSSDTQTSCDTTASETSVLQHDTQTKPVTTEPRLEEERQEGIVTTDSTGQESETSSVNTDSDNETWDRQNIHNLLPDGYEYKVLLCRNIKPFGQLEAEFKI